MNTLLFALVLSSAAPGFSAATVVEPIITRSLVDEHRLEITLANLEQQLTVVRLTDLDQSTEYFSNRIKNHNGYGVCLSLTDIPEGRYVLSVEKGDTVRKQVILKTEKGVMCSEWK